MQLLTTALFERYKKENPQELTDLEFAKLYKELSKAGIDSDAALDFILWCNDLPSRQEAFAKYLMKFLPKVPGTKILEVGCGRTARLSRILAEKGYTMTCIDPKVDVSLLNGIKAIRGKFDYRKFDLSEYDFVIAQEPCDATEHIVRACINQNKPFMISLCGVPHALISEKKSKKTKMLTREEWYDYLCNIDKSKTRFVMLSLDPFSRTPIIRSNQF